VGQFGDKFRKEREKKKLSLDDVAQVTKIGTRMLQAIEDEHFDQLPGGIFNKGFIRAYAKHLGLNEEEAVSQYLECLRKEQIEAQAAWESSNAPAGSRAAGKSSANQAGKGQAGKGTSKAAVAGKSAPRAQDQEEDELSDLQLPRAEHVRKPRREFLDPREGGIPWNLVAVAAVVVVLAFLLWRRHSHATQSQGPKSPTTAVATTSQPASPALVPSLPVLKPAAKITPIASKTAGQPQPASAQSGSQTAKSAPAIASEPKTAPIVTLIIRASENSWISVSANGQVVKEETLIAPAETAIHASGDVTVRVGNAAGVSFLLNGKEIPPQGNEAEVKTLVFDRDGLKPPAAQSPPPGE
jgi:cytoskeletal protein RodZ